MLFSIFIFIKLPEVKKLIPSELLLSKEQRFVNEFPVFEENDDGSFCDKNEGKPDLKLDVRCKFVVKICCL